MLTSFLSRLYAQVLELAMSKAAKTKSCTRSRDAELLKRPGGVRRDRS